MTSSENDLDLLARYAWNMALGAALYAPLQCLEVAFRNTLHTAISGVYGDRWFASSTVLVPYPRTQDAVSKAMAKLANPQATNVPGHVVAALDFGFWTMLLSPPYGSPPSRRRFRQPLWPTLMPAAFPHFPGTTGRRSGRAALAERFDNIRELRNRVSHHEPIWKGRPDPGRGQRVPVNDQFQEILEAIDWISPELSDAIRAMETFTVVIAQGPAPYRKLLATLT